MKHTIEDWQTGQISLPSLRKLRVGHYLKVSKYFQPAVTLPLRILTFLAGFYEHMNFWEILSHFQNIPYDVQELHIQLLTLELANCVLVSFW